jgi:transaldolase
MTQPQLSPLQSLIASGTKLWVDSVDPVGVQLGFSQGATGATSNPIIIADLVKTGRFDGRLAALMAEGMDDETVAWQLTDEFVQHAQKIFAPVWEATRGNDGYVSFELDPMLEDAACALSLPAKAARYVALGVQWAQGHHNRMIKIPATPGGLAALEELTAAGISLNVTLIFSIDQYRAAREAIWRGALRRQTRELFKSVYSIFVSRIDVYTKQHVPQLSAAASGQVGLLNVKRIWQENRAWWSDKELPLEQELVFASTGSKDPADAADKYVAALAGSDIQTNPPATNAAVQANTGTQYRPRVADMPTPDVIAEIDRVVDFSLLERTLLAEGLQKFANPQKALLALIKDKRRLLQSPRQSG